MSTTLLVVAVVSGALVIGALWGLYGPLSDAVRGFLVATAGGALIVAAALELIQPSSENASTGAVAGAVAPGAAVFSGLDWLVDEVWGSSSGGGLLAAITLDGVPENLALGVALIGATPAQVAALAGSILLSNLPEAAGGAKQMADSGHRRSRALGLWVATAVMMSVAAIAGNLLLADAGPVTLALIRSFAAGAVVASLATEVFPEAFREDRQATGLAAALGVVVAFVLGQFGG
jgi:ZIP family zinc transporter